MLNVKACALLLCPTIALAQWSAEIWPAASYDDNNAYRYQTNLVAAVHTTTKRYASDDTNLVFFGISVGTNVALRDLTITNVVNLAYYLPPFTASNYYDDGSTTSNTVAIVRDGQTMDITTKTRLDYENVPVSMGAEGKQIYDITFAVSERTGGRYPYGYEFGLSGGWRSLKHIKTLKDDLRKAITNGTFVSATRSNGVWTVASIELSSLLAECDLPTNYLDYTAFFPSSRIWTQQVLTIAATGTTVETTAFTNANIMDGFDASAYWIDGLPPILSRLLLTTSDTYIQKQVERKHYEFDELGAFALTNVSDSLSGSELDVLVDNKEVEFSQTLSIFYSLSAAWLDDIFPGQSPPFGLYDHICGTFTLGGEVDRLYDYSPAGFMTERINSWTGKVEKTHVNLAGNPEIMFLFNTPATIVQNATNSFSSQGNEIVSAVQSNLTYVVCEQVGEDEICVTNNACALDFPDTEPQQGSTYVEGQSANAVEIESLTVASVLLNATEYGFHATNHIVETLAAPTFYASPRSAPTWSTVLGMREAQRFDWVSSWAIINETRCTFTNIVSHSNSFIYGKFDGETL